MANALINVTAEREMDWGDAGIENALVQPLAANGTQSLDSSGYLSLQWNKLNRLSMWLGGTSEGYQDSTYQERSDDFYLGGLWKYRFLGNNWLSVGGTTFKSNEYELDDGESWTDNFFGGGLILAYKYKLLDIRSFSNLVRSSNEDLWKVFSEKVRLRLGWLEPEDIPLLRFVLEPLRVSSVTTELSYKYRRLLGRGEERHSIVGSCDFLWEITSFLSVGAGFNAYRDTEQQTLLSPSLKLVLSAPEIFDISLQIFAGEPYYSNEY